MALILDQERRFNNFFRTLLFVPWAIPIVIVSLNWRWIFDDLSGFLNNFLITFHITNNIISWLSDPSLAMGCVIAVVVWAGTPFYTMTFLAGLQAIPKELYEAAEIDGASIVQQFFYVTIPAAPHDLPDDGDALHDLDRHEPPVRLHPHQGRPGGSDGDLPAPRRISMALGPSASEWARPFRSCFFPVLVLLIIFPHAPHAPPDRRVGRDATKSGTQRLLRWIGNGLLRRHARCWTLVPVLLDDRDLAEEGQGDLRLRGDLVPRHPTLDAYRLLFVKTPFVKYVRNSHHHRRGDDRRLARVRLPGRVRARPAPLPGPEDDRPWPGLHLPGAHRRSSSSRCSR